MKAISSSFSIAAGRSNSPSCKNSIQPQMNTDGHRFYGRIAPELNYRGVVPAICYLPSPTLFCRGGAALGLPLPGPGIAATYAS